MTRTVLGITGGIGSGKSAVSRLLSCYCLAPLIDLDQCCRHLLDINQSGWLALNHHFGDRYFTNSGALNRPLLRDAIFSDATIRQQVDRLLHPLARAAMQHEMGGIDSKLILVEIPLLYEAGWEREVNKVLVVYARPGAQCCRIMRRDGVSRGKAAQAVSSQMKLTEKARRADYVIDNSGPWSATRDQVIGLGMRLSR